MLYGWYNLKMPKSSQIVKIPRTTARASDTTHIIWYVFQSNEIVKRRYLRVLPGNLRRIS
jgi:hypothetical protein